MAVQALGYPGIGAQDVAERSDFATRRLGLQLVDRGASCRAFRIDDRRQRVIVDKERPDAGRFFGWKAADAASFDALDTPFAPARVFALRRSAGRYVQ
jgi:catechol 2,3-dioxygenase-like lactoylglutathione lyase family enzyme